MTAQTENSESNSDDKEYNFARRNFKRCGSLRQVYLVKHGFVAIKMRITWRAVASLFMSIIFLMGMSTSGINSKWVAHELDQHFYAPGASVATDAPELVATDSSSSKTSGDIENQLLHAVSHVQPLLVSSIFDGFSKSAPHVFIKLPQLFDVPTTDIAPPFRPPRISFPI